MAYAVELKPRATKDLRRISPEQATRIADALEDYDDLKMLRAAKDAEQAAPTTPLREVRRKLRI
jgi:mRNA-degrading endonuclease RelE of RelBE toxin-antitoxin system